MSVRINRIWRVSLPTGARRDDIFVYVKTGEARELEPVYIYGEECDPVWEERVVDLYDFVPAKALAFKKKVTAKMLTDSLDLFNANTFLRESTEKDAWEKRFNLPTGTKVFFTNDYGRQTYVIGE